MIVGERTLLGYVPADICVETEGSRPAVTKKKILKAATESKDEKRDLNRYSNSPRYDVTYSRQLGKLRKKVDRYRKNKPVGHLGGGRGRTKHQSQRLPEVTGWRSEKHTRKHAN